MADTGFVFPGTANSSRAVTGADSIWTDADNIKADDTSAATNSMGTDRTFGLAGSNFDFSGIPAGSTIDGVETSTAYEYNVTAITWTSAVAGGCNLILADDSDGSENKQDELAAPTDAEQTDQAGGASDLWGETIALSDVQDVDWGYFHAMDGAVPNPEGVVEFMSMKVYYTSAVTPALGSLILTGSSPLIPPSIKDVNAGAAWTDGDTNINIDGQFLI